VRETANLEIPLGMARRSGERSAIWLIPFHTLPLSTPLIDDCCPVATMSIVTGQERQYEETVGDRGLLLGNFSFMELPDFFTSWK
jgi:hypothetical protein